MRRTFAFISIFALMISMLALPASASGATYTEHWDGRGSDSLDCSKLDPNREAVEGDGWIHWIFSTKGASTSATLTLGGNQTGVYNPGEPLTAETWHFYTPYSDPAGLTAKIELFGGDRGTGGGLVISDYCPGDPPFVPEGAVTVEKTAIPSFTRTHKWDIEKSVTTEDEFVLDDGTPKIWLYTDGDGDETATWTVDVTYEGFQDSAWKLEGKITATNTGNVGAQIRNWTDSQRPDARIINCRPSTDPEEIIRVFNYVIPVGESVTCDYLVDPANPTVTSNTATVGGWFVLDGAVDSVDDAVGRFSERDTATYNWETPTTEVNKTVNIEDVSDLFGTEQLGSVAAPHGDTFTYEKDFAWADFGRDGCGSYQYDNTATIVETEQSADATLKVNVQCFVGETAWAANANDPGVFRYTNRGNWATYIQIDGLPKVGTIFAGQTIPVGTYVVTGVDFENKTTNVLDITLTGDWVLEPGDETVKIQGYDVAPSGNPAPGRFTTYKGNELKGLNIGNFEFYGIHLNVEQPDPNFGP